MRKEILPGKGEHETHPSSKYFTGRIDHYIRENMEKTPGI
jgi:hypothetical protein